MTSEKWLIHPGETRVIDAVAVPQLKVSLVGGQLDVVTHDEDTIRIEIDEVTVKDLRVTSDDGRLEIDHPQLRWDNFLEVFRNFTGSGPTATVRVSVPKTTDVTIGVVSAHALVLGLEATLRVNSVSGDLVVDGHNGDLHVSAASAETQVRNLIGDFRGKSVSGDLTVTGELGTVSVETVSGTVVIDASGPLSDASINTVSGGTTLRLDEGLPANYVVRSVTGKVKLDGVERGGNGLSNIADSTGDLSGMFVDVRVNSVSGAVAVVRREPIADSPAAPELHAPDSEASSAGEGSA